MYYLSFDIANKSLAISFIFFNNNYRNEIFKINVENKNIESYIKNMKNLNEELNKLFIYYIYEVVDLIPQQKVRDTTIVQRSNKLKEYLKKLNIELDKYIEDNKIQNITVLVEYQPSFNDKSKTIYNQIIYEYSDNKIYKIKVINPLYKNKIYFTKELQHSRFIQKYNNNYIANKNHTKSNFLYILNKYNLEHVIKNIKKKNLDDLADSFMQIIAYIFLIEKI